MKRWLILGAVALAALLLVKDENRPGTDIAKLEPARVLLAEQVTDGVIISTDLGHSGFGPDLESTVRDMEATASGQVFLDTAEFLLISPGAAKWLPELARRLRSSCQVCIVDGTADLFAAAEYLQTHEPECRLGDWRKGEVVLPTLYFIEERMYLAKP